MNEKDFNEPILNSEIENKYLNLVKKKRVFDASVNEISQLMDNLTLDESSNISLITSKFENIKNQMDKILKGINSLNNLIPDENLSDTIKLQTFSEQISKKFKKANTKFQNIIINAKKNLEDQLSMNSDLSTAEKSDEISTVYNLKKELQVQDPFVNKNKIDKIKRAKEEYQKIYDITKSLNQLSEEIKFNAINQDRQIEIIEYNNNDIEENINKGNDEIKKYKENHNEDLDNYFMYIGFLIFIIFIFGIMTYYKYVY